MDNRIEEVARTIFWWHTRELLGEKFNVKWEEAGQETQDAYLKEARQICLLFEKPVQVPIITGEEFKEKYKAKLEESCRLEESRRPDSDRLLTPKEIDKVEKAFDYEELATQQVLDAYLVAQDAKTASEKDAGFVDEKVEFGLSVFEATFAQCKSEFQTKLAEIFREIEENWSAINYYSPEAGGKLVNSIDVETWQALKKEWRIK